MINVYAMILIEVKQLICILTEWTVRKSSASAIFAQLKCIFQNNYRDQLHIIYDVYITAIIYNTAIVHIKRRINYVN